MEEVASSVRDAAVVVPGRAAEEVLDVGHEFLFDAAVQDDGGQGSFSSGFAELDPLVAPLVVDYCFALDGLDG